MKTNGLQLLIILCIPCLLSAQSTTIDASSLTVGEQVFEYVRVQGDSRQVFGTIYERIIRKTDDDVIQITYTQNLPNSTITDSIIVDTETFMPLRYRSVVPGRQDIRINYSIPGNTVIHMKRSTPNQKIDTIIVAETDNMSYDYHWPSIVLYALKVPEAKGESIDVPGFTYRNKQEKHTIRYVGEETLMLNGKKYQTRIWKETSQQSGMDHTYWIDRQSNRLVQNKVSLKDGTFFWIRRKNL